MLERIEQIQNPVLLYVSRSQFTIVGPPHSHEYIELLYVVSGISFYMVGGNIYTISEGDLLVIPAHELHQCTNISGTETADFFAMTLPADQFPDAGCTIYHTSPDSRPALRSLANHMQDEYRKKSPHFRMKLLSYFLDFIVLLLRDTYTKEEQISATAAISVKEQSTLKSAIVYIMQHYTENISLAQIAQSVPISTSHLNRLFQKTLHASPMQYVIQLRLEKATSLLKGKPEITIKETAQLCGYTDTYHFSKLFKKHVGVSPTEYKDGKRSAKQKNQAPPE